MKDGKRPANKSKKRTASSPKPNATPRPRKGPDLIQVPRPAARAFNPSRPLSGNSLLQAQVQHFHELNQQLPVEHKGDVEPHQVITEGEAGEYIRKMTARLHAHHGIGKGKVKKAT